jgi:hypothetical protein
MTWSNYLRGRLEEINARLTNIESMLGSMHAGAPALPISGELPLSALHSVGTNDRLIAGPERNPH